MFYPVKIYLGICGVRIESALYLKESSVFGDDMIGGIDRILCALVRSGRCVYIAADKPRGCALYKVPAVLGLSYKLV